MREITCWISKLIYLIYLVVAVAWFYTLNHDKPEYLRGRVASPEIKQAMIKMGPYKDYKTVNEKLYVKVNKKWLRLSLPSSDM